jgi:predicted Zn-ribbon and HTH transcriptional regulator
MSRSNEPLAVVEVMSGPMDGMTVEIRKQVTQIGRLEKYSVCLKCGYKFLEEPRCPNCRSSDIRMDENDIVLSLDRYASRVHANITFEGGRFWLQDRGSTNGTWFTKGESLTRIVGKEVLNDKDMFLIGHTYLQFGAKNP